MTETNPERIALFLNYPLYDKLWLRAINALQAGDVTDVQHQVERLVKFRQERVAGLEKFIERQIEAGIKVRS